MQVALCAVFAGSVGLASIVTRQRLSAGSIRLEATRWYGRVGVQAPAGWSLESENQGSILLVVQEPDLVVEAGEKQGRRLTVRRAQLEPPVSAEAYLKSSGLVRGTRPLAIEGTDSSESITIAGTTGIVRPVVRPVGISLFSPPTYETQWIACIVRPNGLAITLLLDCPDNSDPQADKRVLRDIASGIEVRDPLSDD